MAIEVKCQICRDPAVKAGVDQLLDEGISQQQIADRLKRSQSAISRHALHRKKPGGARSRGVTGKTTHPGRARSFDKDGRCRTCGLLGESPEPQMMMRRAERALHVGEEIVLRAKANEDDRLALMGLDRVHKSLELCMRAVGLIGSDSVTVNIHQQAKMTAREAIAVIVEATLPEHRAELDEFLRFLIGERTEPPALPATIEDQIEGEIELPTPSEQSETPFRNAENDGAA